MAALAQRMGLRRVAHHNPPMGFEHDPEAMERAVRFIEENPARFSFLAVGSPRQCKVAHAVTSSGPGARHGALHRRQPALPLGP